MNRIVRVSATAIALIAAAPLAAAQTTIIERRAPATFVELSPAQRTVIYRHIIREPVAVVPEVELRIGAPIPEAVELYAMPEQVYVEVPALRRYRYFQVHDQVVLVDPQTSEIVEIIRD